MLQIVNLKNVYSFVIVVSLSSAPIWKFLRGYGGGGGGEFQKKFLPWWGCGYFLEHTLQENGAGQLGFLNTTAEYIELSL